MIEVEIVKIFIFVEIIEPPLNIHCYLDDKMYVKVPMTLKITLVNPTVKAMRLTTSMKNSENFMISGNTQVSQLRKFHWKTFKKTFS